MYMQWSQEFCHAKHRALHVDWKERVKILAAQPLFHPACSPGSWGSLARSKNERTVAWKLGCTRLRLTFCTQLDLSCKHASRLAQLQARCPVHQLPSPIPSHTIHFHKTILQSLDTREAWTNWQRKEKSVPRKMAQHSFPILTVGFSAALLTNFGWPAQYAYWEFLVEGAPPSTKIGNLAASSHT